HERDGRESSAFERTSLFLGERIGHVSSGGPRPRGRSVKLRGVYAETGGARSPEGPERSRSRGTRGGGSAGGQDGSSARLTAEAGRDDAGRRKSRLRSRLRSTSGARSRTTTVPPRSSKLPRRSSKPDALPSSIARRSSRSAASSARSEIPPS